MVVACTIHRASKHLCKARRKGITSIDRQGIRLAYLNYLWVFKRFPLHDVTPMTGRVADGQKNQLVTLSSRSETKIMIHEYSLHRHRNNNHYVYNH